MDDLTDDRRDDPYDGAGAERDGDADLVAQVREGHDEPYAELYRRHQPAALALARTLTQHGSADDVVSEAFEKLLQRIRAGGGPEAAFRPYLLRTVRTVAVDASRRTRRLVVAEDPAEAVGAASSAAAEDAELVDAVHERTTLARAFAALPERWQTFLWLSFVDDADRAEIATILGVNVGSVSALGYRAREGLRRAYLDAHLRDAPTPQCREVWPLLAGAIRGGLGVAQQQLVEEHLAECDHCRAALAELEAVNTRFGAVLAPIVLGAAGPAYLAAIHEGGAAAAAAAAGGAPAAASVAGAGPGGTHAATGTKAGVAGFGKTTAAGVAVLACVSTVAVVAIVAALTAPLGSEPNVAARPGTSISGDGTGEGSGDGSDDTGGGSPDSSSGVGDATSSSADDPTSSGATTDPTSTTGAPTGQPTGGATGPTGGPGGGPAGGPGGGPTTGPPTTPGSPPTSGPTGGSSSPPPAPVTVDAGVGQIAVDARPQTNAPAHIGVPVFLQGGSADLQLNLSVRGLNKFTVTHGTGDGAWSCLATTPMAGANKTAVLRCTLNGAQPADALRLGINLGYSGEGSVTAVLDVLGGVVDSSSADNSDTVKLPTR